MVVIYITLHNSKFVYAKLVPNVIVESYLANAYCSYIIT